MAKPKKNVKTIEKNNSQMDKLKLQLVTQKEEIQTLRASLKQQQKNHQEALQQRTQEALEIGQQMGFLVGHEQLLTLQTQLAEFFTRVNWITELPTQPKKLAQAPKAKATTKVVASKKTNRSFVEKKAKAAKTKEKSETVRQKQDSAEKRRGRPRKEKLDGSQGLITEPLVVTDLPIQD